MKASGHSTLESMSQALWYNRWTMNKFAQYITGDILEVGCGIGNFTPALSHMGTLWAMDIDRLGLVKTKRVSPKHVRVGFGDIEKGTYFFRRQFSCVVCLNVLEHIQNDGQALRNMYTLLKPGGFLILLVPIYPALYGSIDRAIHHYRRYMPKTILDSLRRLHFQIIKHRKLNFFGAVGWWVSGRLLHRPNISKRRIRWFNLIAPWILPLEDIVEPPIGTSILIIAQKK